MVLVEVVSVNDPPVAGDDEAITRTGNPVGIDVTANDTDVDGTVDKSSLQLTSPALNGSTSINPATGIITYSPNLGFVGFDIFQYTADDNLGVTSAVATVVITVSNENVPPVAKTDTTSTVEETEVVTNVAVNDTDVDGTVDPTTIVITTPPQNGTASVGPSAGEITYTPNTDFFGNDTLSYTIRDNEGAESPSGILAIGVINVNDPPLAVNDTVTTSTNTPVDIAALANDIDTDGTLNPTSVLVGPSLNGTTSINPSGEINYAPDPGFSGSDSFTYTVRDDDDATSNTATVTVQVSVPNAPPVANNDDGSTTESVPVVIAVTSNDVDSDGTIDVSTVTVTSQPTNGSTSVDGGTGEVTYTPNNNFTGLEQFTYTVNDDEGATSNAATVTVQVNAVGDNTVTFQPIEDAQVKATSPAKNYGTKTSMKAESGTFSSYLKFSVTGLTENVESATLRLFVDGASNSGGTIHTVSNNFGNVGAEWTEETLIGSNAPAIDPAAILSSIGAVTQGTFVDFDLGSSITGNGTFSFGISSVSGDEVAFSTKEGSSPPQLIIAQGDGGPPANQAPVASDDNATTPENVATTIAVTGNDTDSDGTIDVSTVTVSAAPASGSTSVNVGTGEITYTPNNGFSGTDQFDYTVDDDDGATSNTATVTVTVEADPGTTTLTFQPIDDAQVKATSPTKNYGAKTSTKAEAGTFSSYFKFVVTGLTGNVQSALLRLFVEDTSILGGTVHPVSNNFSGGGGAWAEETLNAGNAPAIDGAAALGSVGAATAGTFVDFDLGSAVTGNGTFSFAINSLSSNLVEYNTKEGINAPQLIITQGGGGPVNQAPVANDDNAITDGDVATTVAVTANDVDNDGTIDVSTVTVTAGPTDGSTAVDAGTGQITYTPDNGFTGTDQFSYTVDDDDGATSNAATVTVEVQPSGSLTFQPIDDAQVKATSPTKNYGTKTTTKAESGTFSSYFKFVVTGLTGNVQSALLRLFVEDTSTSGGTVHAVSNNFSGGGGEWAEETLIAGNAPVINAAAALSSTGAATAGTFVDFNLASAVTGNGTFSFAISSVSGDMVEYSTKEGSNSPQLIITQGGGPVNQAPVASDDNVVTTEDLPTVIAVTTNDVDNDGTIDVSTVTVIANPADGTATVDAGTGQITYTPNNGFTGTDQFSYTVDDDDGATSNVATVTVQVDATGGNSLIFQPTDDAQVKATDLTKNYGGKTTMKVESGTFSSYMKFIVSGVTGTVQSAVIRLSVTDASDSGGTIHSVSTNFTGTATPWTEGILNSSNAPVISAGAALSSLGAVVPGNVVEFDLGSAITGNGTFAFAINTASNDVASFSTKEGTTAPQLIVNVTGGTQNTNSGNAPELVTFVNRSVSSVGASPVVINMDEAGSDGNGSQVTVSTQPSNGLVAHDADGDRLIYTPSQDFIGTDSFQYTLSSPSAAKLIVTVTITVAAPEPTTLTFVPIEDALVQSSRPTDNFGSAVELSATNLASPSNSYLKFHVEGLTGSVQRAVLRLWVVRASDEGGTVFLVANNLKRSNVAWTEDNMVWDNAPAISGSALSEMGAVAAEDVIEFDVTKAVAANGIVSFAISKLSSEAVGYDSKEGVYAPQLVVETAPHGLSEEEVELADAVGTVEAPLIPMELVLHPNYPNPFNAGTNIEYSLPVDAKVRLVIFNIRGQLVKILVADDQKAGFKRVQWFGKNDDDVAVGSGMYFLHLEVGDQKFSRRIILQK